MFGSETLDDSVRRLWWLYLVTGILWSLWGLMILSLRPSSIASVAILAGVSFILGGIGQFFLARRVEEWRWLFYVGGVLAILAGIMTFVWPGKTLLVLAVFVSWYLVVSGIFTVVGAFVGPVQRLVVGHHPRRRGVPAGCLGDRIADAATPAADQPRRLLHAVLWHLGDLRRLRSSFTSRRQECGGGLEQAGVEVLERAILDPLTQRLGRHVESAPTPSASLRNRNSCMPARSRA